MGHHSRVAIADAAAALPAALDHESARAAAVRAEWVSLATLRLRLDAWESLASRALEANVFYEPAFALPAMAAFGADAGAILVWSTAQPGRLLGLFPHRVERARYGLGPSVLVGWTHPYAPFAAPLVDRGEAVSAVAGWLDFVLQESKLPNLILMPYVAVDGAFARILRAALAGRGGRAEALEPHSRALLAPTVERSLYLRSAMSAKKRKELRRLRRRLDDGGKVSIATASTPENIPAALASFMTLEMDGWKGAIGTAAAHHAVTRNFMQQAVAALAQRSQVRIERLLVGDKLLAAAIVLRSGSTGWFWKIAYDEEAARASPGVQLALELTRSLLSDASLAQVDSCATPDHPMIDHLWRERLDLADLLIAPSRAAAPLFTLAHPLERGRRGLITAAKWARRRLRGR